MNKKQIADKIKKAEDCIILPDMKECKGDMDSFPKECCDFNNGVRSVQMRKYRNGQYQIRENENDKWIDCEIEFDELGNLKSISYVIKTIPVL